MSVKLIAIGNRLMGDDAVAIHIAERLRGSLERKSIKVIIGETDFQYCLNKIEDKDRIILMDATCFGIQPGKVTAKSIIDIYKLGLRQNTLSQHGYSLISALNSYYRDLEVLVIGIEGIKFDFDLTLSSNLNNLFEDICEEVQGLCDNFLFKEI